MLIRTLPVGPLQVNCYLVACPRTKKAMVIDPGDEGENILELLAHEGWELELVVNTHGHFDHVGANYLVIEKTGVELCMHRDDLPLLKVAAQYAGSYGLPAVESPEPQRFLANGDIVEVGDLRFEVIHTPGHSQHKTADFLELRYAMTEKALGKNTLRISFHLSTELMTTGTEKQAARA